MDGGGDQLEEALVGQVLETGASEGNGDLEAVARSGGGDNIPLRDIGGELGVGVLIEEVGDIHSLTSLFHPVFIFLVHVPSAILALLIPLLSLDLLPGHSVLLLT